MALRIMTDAMNAICRYFIEKGLGGKGLIKIPDIVVGRG